MSSNSMLSFARYRMERRLKAMVQPDDEASDAEWDAYWRKRERAYQEWVDDDARIRRLASDARAAHLREMSPIWAEQSRKR